MERVGVIAAAPLHSIEIRRAVARDAREISDVAKASPGAALWTEQQFLEAAAGNCSGWVAVQDGRVAGFIFARIAADEAEILNLAVAPEIRGCGASARLLQAAMEFAREGGAKRLFLDVRESNTKAIAFYKRAGFEDSGRRRSYYRDPIEDACVLTRHIKSAF
jgi:ribosomal-protein-alanine N-acetyltransferase